MATDKENLTFCNASNLDWQYVELKKSVHYRESEERYSYLSELLDPKNFIKEYKDENGKITDRVPVYKDIEEMRSKAGVLMNYREECGKNSKEGNFLSQWEVIDGGDSYKLVSDYIIEIQTQLNMKFKIPTREKIENNENLKFFFNITFNILSKFYMIATWFNPSKEAVTENVIKREFAAGNLLTYGQKTGSLPLMLAGSVLGKVEGETSWKAFQKAIVSGKNAMLIAAEAQTGIYDYKTKVEEEKAIKSTNDLECRITENLPFYKKGFHFLVVKKDSEIIIAYKSTSEIESNNILSDEVNYLNLVYSKIKRLYKDYKIQFVGFDKGANLALISSLLFEENSKLYLKKTLESKYKVYKFTLEDINTKYVPNISIDFSGTVMKNLTVQGLGIFAFGYLATGIFKSFAEGLLSRNIYTLLIWSVVSILSDYAQLKRNELTQEQFNMLINLGLILKDGTVVKDKKNIEQKISVLDANTKTGKREEVIKTDLISGIFLKFNGKEIHKKNNYYNIVLKKEYNKSAGKDQNITIYAKYILIDGVYSFESITMESDISKTIENIDPTYGTDIMKCIHIANILYIKGRIAVDFDSKMSKYIKTTVVSNGDSYSDDSDEMIFLPYIQKKDGNINGSSIREEYIRNSLRDMVAYFARDSHYKMNLVNDGILKCLKFFANEIEDYEYGGATIKSGIKTKISRSGNFLFSEYLYKKFKGKVGDLQNYYTKTATNDYYQLDFIKEPQMLYGYGENSLTTRSTSPIKVIRGSDTLPAKNFKETIDEILPPKVENKEKYVAGIVYKYGDVYITDRNRVILAYDLRYQGEDEKNAENYNKINDLKTVVRSPATGHIHLVEYCNYKRDTYNKMIDNRHKIIIEEIHDKPVEGKKEKVPVSYFHVIELLKPLHPTAKNETSFNIGDFVEVGTEIGYMTKPAKGKENNPKVHYYMMMKSSRNTGSINAALPSNYKKKTENINIVLNPKNYWDEGEEYGSLDYKRTGVDQDYM